MSKVAAVPTQARRSIVVPIAFGAFAVLSLVHVVLLGLEIEPAGGATKLLLMPALALAVVIALRGRVASLTGALLLGALAFSWLGDGAATFVPFAPTLPVMLGAFGIAHVAYIVLFTRARKRRSLPIWTLVYALWWGVLLAVLLPHLGALTLAVAAYGIVLAGTAATAARTTPVIAAGAALFLASDTILAFRLFLPDAMPAWTSPAVMATYTAGQGLIAYGVVRLIARTHGVATGRRDPVADHRGSAR